MLSSIRLKKMESKIKIEKLRPEMTQCRVIQVEERIKKTSNKEEVSKKNVVRTN